MPELRIDVEESYYQMLKSLQPLAEAVIEEKLDFDSFVNKVLWRGIRGIIEDIMPTESDALRQSILMMYESRPEFVSSFIANLMEGGTQRELARERLGFLRD